MAILFTASANSVQDPSRIPFLSCQCPRLPMTYFSSHILIAPSSSPATKYLTCRLTIVIQVTGASKRSAETSSADASEMPFAMSNKDVRETDPDARD